MNPTRLGTKTSRLSDVDTGLNTGVPGYGSCPVRVYSFARQSDGKLIVVELQSTPIPVRAIWKQPGHGFPFQPGDGSLRSRLAADGRVLVGATTGIRRLTTKGYNGTTFRVESYE